MGGSGKRSKKLSNGKSHHMITVIIPTRNRAYTLQQVLDSYYQQELVSEVIVVDDAGEDETEQVCTTFSQNYKNTTTKYIRHAQRSGAAAGRISGYKAAQNDYILFGEDDAFLDQNYAKTLYEKLSNSPKTSIVAGRIIYLKYEESKEEAIVRFGNGLHEGKYFNKFSFSFDPNVIIKSDISVPFVHALFLTRKSCLNSFQYDPYYSKGNGYREETDFQLNVFTNGGEILLTNDSKCFHFHRKQVRSGGQRISRIKILYWNIHYTFYFYGKYFYKARDLLNISHGLLSAKIIFAVHQGWELFFRPLLKLAKARLT